MGRQDTRQKKNREMRRKMKKKGETRHEMKKKWEDET